MAWATVTHCCGHQQEHQLVGNRKDRDRRADWLSSTLCRECFIEERKEAHIEAENKAVEETSDLELPVLVGSEKQVAWAEKLRAVWLQSTLELLERDLYWIMKSAKDGQSRAKAIEASGAKLTAELLGQTREAIRPLIYEWVAGRLQAKFWIDQRDLPSGIREQCAKAIADASLAIVEALIKGEDPAEAEARATAERDRELERQREAERQRLLAREKMRADATMTPETPRSAICADLVIADDCVIVTYEERDENFANVMKSLRFRWDATCWRYDSSQPDRLIETACKLLAARFPVRVYDAELRARVLKADYKPRITRWIKVAHHRLTWFVISWDKDENYYQEAKRLDTARYAKPNVEVQADNWEQVVDFAERYKFTWSKAAAEVRDALKKARTDSVAITLPPLPQAEMVTAPHIEDGIPQIPIPENVDIAPSLLEDDWEEEFEVGSDAV